MRRSNPPIRNRDLFLMRGHIGTGGVTIVRSLGHAPASGREVAHIVSTARPEACRIIKRTLHWELMDLWGGDRT
jgi:hypothetical protein